MILRQGARSARAAAELLALGFSNVSTVRGGMQAVRSAEPALLARRQGPA